MVVTFCLGEKLHAFLALLHVQCKSPKKDSSQPLNGNHAIEAGTPMLMPTMPALMRCLNSRAALPRTREDRSAVAVGERLASSMAASKSSKRITLSTGPKISSRATVMPPLHAIQNVAPTKNRRALRHFHAAAIDGIFAPSFAPGFDQLLDAVAMLPGDDRPHVRLDFAVGGADFDGAGGFDD
jgi:hypothetical protein